MARCFTEPLLSTWLGRSLRAGMGWCRFGCPPGGYLVLMRPEVAASQMQETSRRLRAICSRGGSPLEVLHIHIYTGALRGFLVKTGSDALQLVAPLDPPVLVCWACVCVCVAGGTHTQEPLPVPLVAASSPGGEAAPCALRRGGLLALCSGHALQPSAVSPASWRP